MSSGTKAKGSPSHGTLTLIRGAFRPAVPLGIGTMLWGNTWLDKRVNGRLLSTEEASAIVNVATEAGITFYDTAEGYGGGTCEEMLGAAFNKSGYNTEAKTELFVLATKYLPTLWRWTERNVLSAIDASNKRLGITCCPLYFIHSPVHPMPLELWVRACGKAYQQGKIKALGLSNCNAAQIKRSLLEARKYNMPIVANQILMNLLVYKSPKFQETLQCCLENDITVIAYSPIGQGLLVDGLSEEKTKKIRLSRMVGVTFDDLQPLRNALHSIAERQGKSMAQVAIRWIVEKGAIPLVGTRSVPQLKDTLGALDVHLTAEEVATLDSLAKGKHTFEKPKWRRSLFVVFISLLMTAYRVNRMLGKLASFLPFFS